MADSNVKAFLARPASEWGNEVFRNQNASIDPITAECKVDNKKL
jgi:hypothetical protein